MQIYQEIKRFVQETLGCLCPEDVFNEIDYRNEGDGSLRIINVGGRLLIYILTVDEKSGIQGIVHPVLDQGVKERDSNGFNRFRLVLVTTLPEELRSVAEHVFASSGYTDEKTHLHVVNKSEVESIWDTQEQMD